MSTVCMIKPTACCKGTQTPMACTLLWCWHWEMRAVSESLPRIHCNHKKFHWDVKVGSSFCFFNCEGFWNHNLCKVFIRGLEKSGWQWNNCIIAWAWKISPFYGNVEVTWGISGAVLPGLPAIWWVWKICLAVMALPDISSNW